MKVVLLIFAALLVGNPSTDEIEKILSQHIKAMGGKEKWQDLRSYRQVYSKENGLSLTITCKMPDKIIIRFQNDQLDASKVYDGAHGFILKNGEYLPMRPGEAIEMAEEPHYYSDLLLAEEMGYKLEYLGKESIDGIVCNKLKLTKSPKDQQTYWINTQTHLIEQTGEYSEDPAHEGIYYKTRLSDYRNVDGLMFPFRQALIANDEAPRYSVVEEMEINFAIANDAFQFQPDATKNLIQYWQDRFEDIGLSSFTFEQETIRFRNGQKDSSIWQEAVQYPDYFRIDIGAKEKQNINLYRADSIYILRNGELVRKGLEIQTSVLMEGRLYDLPVDSMLEKLRSVGINTDVFGKAIYKGRPAYILGALAEDSNSPQIWMDAERRVVLRKVSKLKDGRMLDALYDEFLEFNGSWIESWIEFYIDGELIQTERYRNINTNPALSPEVFDPLLFKNNFWY